MGYVLEVRLRTTQTNLSLTDYRLSNWRFRWDNNIITAITTVSNDAIGSISATFDLLHTPLRLDLGLLVDVLTLATGLCISTKIEYYLYQSDKTLQALVWNSSQPFTTVLANTHAHSLVSRGDTSDEWPIRIMPGYTQNLDQDAINLAEHILQLISTRRFNTREKKIVNYWRRGFDLYFLEYENESFLVFFKILEYFEKRAHPETQKLTKKIMKFFIKLWKFGNTSSGTEIKALKIISGAGITNSSQGNIDIICDFIVARNNMDVAHSRITPLPQEREGALYLVHFPGWDLQSHIKEVTRLFVLKFIDVTRLTLVNDGGLLRLEKV